MLFNSHEFLFIFLPVTLLGYLVCGRMSVRALLAWLALASLFFYGWWNPRYLLLIGFSVVANYLIGEQIRRSLAAGAPTTTRTLLVAGVALNLSLIGFFKYADFMLNTGSYVLDADWPALNIVLPIAISFFTFQQIAYLVDTSRGQTARPDFLEYGFFVVFFPQLIAGPIVNFKDLYPQFRHISANYRALYGNLAIGISIFAVGLFKKVVIADSLSPIAGDVFNAAASGESLHALDAWRGVLAYTFQIYFDFSGYSDMAIGLAHMFGFRLPINFHSPYKATSIIDFWRRWHITLSRFLREYLYIPLGGNRRGRVRRHVNLMITMLLGGLWHGANWTFVIWGGLHGMFLVINHAWRYLGLGLGESWWASLLSRSLTLLAVCVAWVFFRADSFTSAQVVLHGMVTLPSGWTGADTKYALCLLALFAFVWYAPNTQQIIGYLGAPGRRAAWAAAIRRRWRPEPVRAVLTGALLAGAVLGLNRVSEFIYFQF